MARHSRRRGRKDRDHPVGAEVHTEPPPSSALEAWLDANGTVEDRYGHLLLEQIKPIDESLNDALRPYFASAHFDACKHFHKQAGIDLHPDASAAGARSCYPDCLPVVARRGLFSEVIAGLNGFEVLTSQILRFG
jgi:hypothetical protein